MGVYLNPGNQNFWKAVRSEIYVDKTGLIAFTNKHIKKCRHTTDQRQKVCTGA